MGPGRYSGCGSARRRRVFRAAPAALAASLVVQSCIKTDRILDAFNSGAIDSSGGDPSRTPEQLKRHIVSQIVKRELIDAYFTQSDGASGDANVVAWMKKAATNGQRFRDLAVSDACARGSVIGSLCGEPDAGGAAAPPAPAPTPTPAPPISDPVVDASVPSALDAGALLGKYDPSRATPFDQLREYLAKGDLPVQRPMTKKELAVQKAVQVEAVRQRVEEATDKWRTPAKKARLSAGPRGPETPFATTRP